MRTRARLVFACSVLAACASLSCSSPASRNAATPAAHETPAEVSTPASAELATQASFALSVDRSTITPLGKKDLRTESAFVTYTNEFFGGKVNALKIHFLPHAIPEDAIAELSSGDTGELTREGSATLVLFLDDHDAITQANLTYVIPGTTIARTVASTPEELAKGFPDFRFDGKRLQLKSAGTYVDAGSDGEKLSLSWTMDLDLPVVDQRKPL